MDSDDIHIFNCCEWYLELTLNFLEEASEGICLSFRRY